MRKALGIFVILAILPLSGIAQEKFWFYAKVTISGVFYYSQVIKCSQAVSSPGYFFKSDARGPFSTRREASSDRREEINDAKDQGRKRILRNVDCDTRWK